jgi:hypothetical protein
MKIVTRLLALVFGLFFVVICIRRLPKLPLPDNAEAVGYDLFWLAVMGFTTYLLVYGARLFARSRERQDFD